MRDCARDYADGGFKLPDPRSDARWAAQRTHGARARNNGADQNEHAALRNAKRSPLSEPPDHGASRNNARKEKKEGRGGKNELSDKTLAFHVPANESPS